MRPRNCRIKCIKAARIISLIINNFLISLIFHRKVTALLFRPDRHCDKQAGIGVIDQTMLILRHAGARHPGAAIPLDLPKGELFGHQKGAFVRAINCASPLGILSPR
jgi:hypothetical protein